MGSSPDAPSMSPQEMELLSTQSDLLKLYVNSIGQQQAENSSYSDLMKGMSGLYREGDVKTTVKVLDIDKVNSEIDRIMRTPEYLAGNENQIRDVNTLTEYAKNPEKGIEAGWYKFGEGTRKGMVVDEEAVGTLKQKLARTAAMEAELQEASAARALAGLRGELPVSEGTRQAKTKEFQLLKESAAQRGIKIEGDDPTGATSDSTSGNEILKAFNSRYGLIEGSERTGDLSLLNSPSLSYQPGAMATGYVGASAGYGPGATAGMIPGAIGAAGSIAQPYQNQRMLQYQGAMGQYQAQQQMYSDVLNLGGTIGAAKILA